MLSSIVCSCYMFDGHGTRHTNGFHVQPIPGRTHVDGSFMKEDRESSDVPSCLTPSQRSMLHRQTAHRPFALRLTRLHDIPPPISFPFQLRRASDRRNELSTSRARGALALCADEEHFSVSQSVIQAIRGRSSSLQPHRRRPYRAPDRISSLRAFIRPRYRLPRHDVARPYLDRIVLSV